MVFIWGILLFFQANVIEAKPITGIIENLTIKNSHGETPDKMTQWDRMDVHIDWSIPDNYVKEGDTMTITLPDELRLPESLEFLIYDEKGQVVAKAVTHPESKTVVLTFTDYCEKHSNVSGSLWFSTYIDTSKVLENGMIYPKFEVEGEIHIGNAIEYEKDISPTVPLAKYGFITEENNKIQYGLVINTGKENFLGVVVRDELITEGINYIPDSIAVYKVTWEIGSTGAWEAQDEELDTNIIPKIAADGRSFEVELGDLQGQGYWIKYQVDIGRSAVSGEHFYNKAMIISEEEVIGEKELVTEYVRGGGDGSGDNLEEENEKPNVTVTPTPVVTKKPDVTVTPTPVVTKKPDVTVTPTPVVTKKPDVTVTPTPVVTKKPDVTVTPTPVVTKTLATPTPAGSGLNRSAKPMQAKGVNTNDNNHLAEVLGLCALTVIIIGGCLLVRTPRKNSK